MEFDALLILIRRLEIMVVTLQVRGGLGFTGPISPRNGKSVPFNMTPYASQSTGGRMCSSELERTREG